MGENHVEGFAQDDNFMLDYEQFGENIRQRPKVGQSLGLIPYNFPKIDRAFLEGRFKKTNARELVNNAIPKQQTKEVLPNHNTLPEGKRNFFPKT
jgi:hypothetical protein